GCGVHPAATVAAPAFHTVRAAPRSRRMNRSVRGCTILAGHFLRVHDLKRIVVLCTIEQCSDTEVAEAMVMTERLAIHCDDNQCSRIPCVDALEFVVQAVCLPEQIPERDAV